MDPLARLPLSPAELRRLPAVGRGAQLDLHKVSSVVLVDVLDHGAQGVAMARGTAVVLAWVKVRHGEALGVAGTEVLRTVKLAQVRGVDVVVVVREAGALERARAWYRWRRWQVQRWLWERRTARRAR